MSFKSINPERRDPSYYKHKSELGLSKVDNLSASEIVEIVSDSYASRRNQKKIGDPVSSVGEETFIPLFETQELSSTNSMSVGLYDGDKEISSFNLSFSYFSPSESQAGNVSYLIDAPENDSYLSKFHLVLRQINKKLVGGLWTENLASNYKIGISLINWTPGTHLLNCSVNEITTTARDGQELVNVRLNQAHSFIGSGGATSISVYDQNGEVVNLKSNYTTEELAAYDIASINGVPFIAKKGVEIDGEESNDARHITVAAKHGGTNLEDAGEHDWEVLGNVKKANLGEDSPTNPAKPSTSSLISSSASDFSDFGLVRLSGYGKLGSDKYQKVEDLTTWYKTLGLDSDVVSVGLFKNFVSFITTLTTSTQTEECSLYFEDSSYSDLIVEAEGQKDIVIGVYSSEDIYTKTGDKVVKSSTAVAPTISINTDRYSSIQSGSGPKYTFKINVKPIKSSFPSNFDITFTRPSGSETIPDKVITVHVHQKQYETKYGILKTKEGAAEIARYDSFDAVTESSLPTSTSVKIQPIMSLNATTPPYEPLPLTNYSVEIKQDEDSRGWLSSNLTVGSDFYTLNTTSLENLSSSKKTAVIYLFIYNNSFKQIGKVKYIIEKNPVNKYLRFNNQDTECSVEVIKAKSTTQVSVSTNSLWEIDKTTIPSWITIPEIDKLNTINSFSVVTEKNYNQASRQAIITARTIGDNSDNVTTYLIVNQKGASNFFDIVGYEGNDVYVFMSKSLGGGELANIVDITYNTDTSWVIEHLPSWVSASKTIGKAGTGTIRFEAISNPEEINTNDKKDCYIAFSYWNEEKKSLISVRKIFVYYERWTTTSSGIGPFPEYILKKNLGMYPFGSVSRSYDSNKTTFKTEYIFGDTSPMFRLTPEFIQEGSLRKTPQSSGLYGIKYPNLVGDGLNFLYSTGYITWDCLENNPETDWTAETITEFSTGRSGEIKIQCQFPSPTAKYKIFSPDVVPSVFVHQTFARGLEISGSNVIEVPAEGQDNIQIPIKGLANNSRWFITNESIPGWISIDSIFGSINDKTPTISVDQNLSGEDREFTLTFSDRFLKDTEISYTIKQRKFDVKIISRVLSAIHPMLCDDSLENAGKSKTQIKTVYEYIDSFTISSDPSTVYTRHSFEVPSLDVCKYSLLLDNLEQGSTYQASIEQDGTGTYVVADEIQPGKDPVKFSIIVSYPYNSSIINTLIAFKAPNSQEGEEETKIINVYSDVSISINKFECFNNPNIPLPLELNTTSIGFSAKRTIKYGNVTVFTFESLESCPLHVGDLAMTSDSQFNFESNDNPYTVVYAGEVRNGSSKICVRFNDVVYDINNVLLKESTNLISLQNSLISLDLNSSTTRSKSLKITSTSNLVTSGLKIQSKNTSLEVPYLVANKTKSGSTSSTITYEAGTLLASIKNSGFTGHSSLFGVSFGRPYLGVIGDGEDQLLDQELDNLFVKLESTSGNYTRTKYLWVISNRGEEQITVSHLTDVSDAGMYLGDYTVSSTIPYTIENHGLGNIAGLSDSLSSTTFIPTSYFGVETEGEHSFPQFSKENNSSWWVNSDKVVFNFVDMNRTGDANSTIGLSVLPKDNNWNAINDPNSGYFKMSVKSGDCFITLPTDTGIITGLDFSSKKGIYIFNIDSTIGYDFSFTNLDTTGSNNCLIYKDLDDKITTKVGSLNTSTLTFEFLTDNSSYDFSYLGNLIITYYRISNGVVETKTQEIAINRQAKTGAAIIDRPLDDFNNHYVYLRKAPVDGSGNEIAITVSGNSSDTTPSPYNYETLKFNSPLRFWWIGATGNEESSVKKHPIGFGDRNGNPEYGTLKNFYNYVPTNIPNYISKLKDGDCGNIGNVVTSSDVDCKMQVLHSLDNGYGELKSLVSLYTGLAYTSLDQSIFYDEYKINTSLSGTTWGNNESEPVKVLVGAPVPYYTARDVNQAYKELSSSTSNNELQFTVSVLSNSIYLLDSYVGIENFSYDSQYITADGTMFSGTIHKLADTQFTPFGSNIWWYSEVVSVNGIKCWHITCRILPDSEDDNVQKMISAINEGGNIGQYKLTLLDPLKNVGGTLNKSYTFRINIPTTNSKTIRYGVNGLSELTPGDEIYDSNNNKLTVSSKSFNRTDGKFGYIIYSGDISKIGDICFQNKTALTSIDLPYGVVELGTSCFEGCSKLEAINIPTSVISLGTDCFNSCAVLENVTFNYGSLNSLGNECFKECIKLREISLQNESNLKTIGSSCFEGCNNLTALKLPGSLISLGENFIKDCTSLTKIYYRGTMAQWRTLVQSLSGWVPVKLTVKCSDGDLDYNPL